MNLNISVIVPVYNMEKYLERCVNSILDQTYKDFELLLVDDGSKDRSLSICKEYAEKDQRIRIIEKENGGLMSAWMAGLKEAKGDYCCFVDSDDWIEPDMLMELSSQLHGGGKEVICSNYLIEKQNSSIPVLQAMQPGSYDRNQIEQQIIPNILGNEQRIITFSRCMKLISTELIVDNLQFCNTQIKMGEDLNIMLPVLLDANRITIMEKGLFYHYFYESNSMVHKYDKNMYQNMQLLYKQMKQVVQVKRVPNGEHLVNREYLLLLFYVIKNELRNPKAQYQERLKEILLDETITSLFRSEILDIRVKSNRLLYYIMKRPTYINILIGRVAITLSDHMRK